MITHHHPIAAPGRRRVATATTSAALALLAVACADPTGLAHGERPIVGGQLVQPTEYPSVVALEWEPGQFFCTGVLVDPMWVLTAAHCVTGEALGDFEIRIGDANLNDTTGGQVAEVAAIHGHPSYQDDIADHDVAAIELASPLDQPPTPVHRQAVAAGTSVAIVGYGVAFGGEPEDGSGLLRDLTSDTIDCADIGDPTIDGDRLICFDATDGTGTCFGDSGGPTFIDVGGRREVAGVTSFGTGDECGTGYDAQTLVSAELAFVDQYVPVVADEPDDEGPGSDSDGEGGGGGAVGPERDDGGCSTSDGIGGGTGAAMAALLLVGLLVRTRRAAATAVPR